MNARRIIGLGAGLFTASIVALAIAWRTLPEPTVESEIAPWKALMIVYGVVTAPSLFTDVCAERFPEAADRYRENHAHWQFVYRLTIDEVEQLVRDEMAKDPPPGGASEAPTETFLIDSEGLQVALDAQRLKLVERMDELGEKSAKNSCEAFQYWFGTPQADPEISYSEELGIMREWASGMGTFEPPADATAPVSP